jgi:dipeptidyl aminopeptidase/acylaminoacyl peptidase
MSLDGAARPVASDISGADWSPDGKDLAVVHHVGGVARLEYPIGHVLYETVGYVSDIRVAPDGRSVAFIDHPASADDRGTVRTVDVSKHLVTLSGEFDTVGGLAWSADGGSIFFSALNSTEPLTIRRVSAGGRVGSSGPAVAVAAPGWLRVSDISASGAMLAFSESARREVGVKLRGDPLLRELTWLEGSWRSSLSQDGLLFLLTHVGGSNYGVGYRRTDGSPLVSLGEGNGMGLSPDGRWAIVVLMATKPAQLVAYPTGTGSAVRLPAGAIDTYDPDSLVWLPDNRTFLFRASEPNRPLRTYVQSLAGGDPRPALPDPARATLASLDGTRVVALETGGSWGLYPLQGGAMTELRGLKSDDLPVGWSNDGRAVLVSTLRAIPARIERVDLVSGTRTVVREVLPGGHGAYRIRVRNVSQDGEQFTYDMSRYSTTLHLIRGVYGAGK